MLITYLIVIIAMALNSMPSLFILKLTSAEVHFRERRNDSRVLAIAEVQASRLAN
jgi:hypothetical protein